MNREKIGECFFYFVFAFWYLTEIIFNTTVEKIMDIPAHNINNTLNSVIFILIMIEIVFLQRYSFKELALIGIFTLPIGIATMCSEHHVFMSFWMFVVASKYVDFDKAIHIAYVILSISIPVVILLCYVGLLNDAIIYRDGVVRHSLGFIHPNQLGIRVFQWSLCNCFINRRKIQIFNYFLLIMAIIFVYKIPNSQTSVIGMAVFLILLLVRHFVTGTTINKRIMKLMYVGTAIISILCIFLSFNYSNRNIALHYINKMLSYRFSSCRMVLNCYNVKLFGQRVSLLFQDRHTVGVFYKLYLDDAYMHLLIVYGVVVFSLFIIMYLLTMKHFADCEDYLLVSILFVYSVYGIMEMGMYSISNNIFLISLSSFIYRNKLLRLTNDAALKIRLYFRGGTIRGNNKIKYT